MAPNLVQGVSYVLELVDAMSNVLELMDVIPNVLRELVHVKSNVLVHMMSNILELVHVMSNVLVLAGIFLEQSRVWGGGGGGGFKLELMKIEREAVDPKISGKYYSVCLVNYFHWNNNLSWVCKSCGAWVECVSASV